jgi:hypothetical protein
MHCNGAIGYGPVSNSANSIAVRARGTAGGESLSLRLDNTNVATWTLTTSYQTYSASTNLTGSITVAFTNDGGVATYRSITSPSTDKRARPKRRATTPRSIRMAVAVAAATANGCIATA